MSLAQHQNTCPIILGFCRPRVARQRLSLFPHCKTFRRSLPPCLPPSLSLSLVFFHLLPPSRKTMNGIIDACNFRKTQRCTRGNELFPLCRDVAIFFNGVLQCTRATNPFHRERETHRAFSRVHNSLARVQRRRHLEYTRREYRIYILDESQVIRIIVLDRKLLEDNFFRESKDGKFF